MFQLQPQEFDVPEQPTKRAEGIQRAAEPRPICTCRSFELPHDPDEHRTKLTSDYDWRSFEELKNTTIFKERVR